MRGKLPIDFGIPSSGDGSSPHAWETRMKRPTQQVQLRFIPTCVGNSRRITMPQGKGTVHPHMRGKLVCWYMIFICLFRFIPTCVGNSCSYLPVDDIRSGSSPHAWETRMKRPTQQVQLRFIPTCVGNSRRITMPQGKGTVHPHMRGKLLTKSSARSAMSGSSPHAWETRARPVHPFAY